MPAGLDGLDYSQPQELRLTAPECVTGILPEPFFRIRQLPDRGTDLLAQVFVFNQSYVLLAGFKCVGMLSQSVVSSVSTVMPQFILVAYTVIEAGGFSEVEPMSCRFLDGC